jgi:hypothetical protein
MDRVREKIFLIVVLLYSVLITVLAYMDTTTPDSPPDHPHIWIASFESDVYSAYKVTHHGEPIFRNCP